MASTKRLIGIGKAAAYLNVSIDTLRRWDETGKLRAIRSPGHHRYYESEALEQIKKEPLSLAQIWVNSQVAPEISREYYADTQDRFRARQERMTVLMARENPAMRGLVSLLGSLAGEIGNNSFDHNFGNWPDVQGVFFAHDLQKREIVLADRGVGIRATLLRVRSDLTDDIEALRVAMTEQITGRPLERRGNGLKFVREVALDNVIGISLQSGTAVATIGKEDKQFNVGLADRNIRGVLARIGY